VTEAEQKEESTWKRRYLKLVDEGIDPDEAHDLAAQLMMRERDPYDDRRVCFECEKYMGGLCLGYLKNNRPTHPLRFILQRCDKFQLKKKKKYVTLLRD
jgi:hypothetical protein